jgi:hypothetical protein
MTQQKFQPVTNDDKAIDQLRHKPRNTKGESITVPLTSSLTGLD